MLTQERKTKKWTRKEARIVAVRHRDLVEAQSVPKVAVTTIKTSTLHNVIWNLADHTSFKAFLFHKMRFADEYTLFASYLYLNQILKINAKAPSGNINGGETHISKNF